MAKLLALERANFSMPQFPCKKNTCIIKLLFHEIVGQAHLLTCVHTYKRMDTNMIIGMHIRVKGLQQHQAKA